VADSRSAALAALVGELDELAAGLQTPAGDA